MVVVVVVVERFVVTNLDLNLSIYIKDMIPNIISFYAYQFLIIKNCIMKTIPGKDWKLQKKCNQKSGENSRGLKHRARSWPRFVPGLC